jgi:hypothetical protein
MQREGLFHIKFKQKNHLLYADGFLLLRLIN